MPLKQYLNDDLTKLKTIVSSLDDHQFTKPLVLLSESSIGQHVRHILEFYLTVSENALNVISYDNRKRDKTIETSRNRCLEKIDAIIDKIAMADETKALMVAANYSENKTDATYHPSTVSREMGYVLEHSIHHQAMIKIGLAELGQPIPVNIGIAPSSQRYKNNYS